jgi:glycerol uptake facilitator protein
MSAPEKSTLVGECVAEFLGTLVLIALGDGVVAMVVLLKKGDYVNITLGWGLGVTMGIYVAGRLTGAHLNPAVTLAVALFRRFPWRKVAPYMLAQVVGAFVGAALVYLNYLPAFDKVDPLRSETVGVFATMPAFPEAWSFGLLDQIVGTALLVGLIFAITDPRNQPAPILTPILVGLVVVAIGLSWGGMHGYAINPARDFGPRLFTFVAGFQNTGFGTNAWWVPIVGPLVGGLLGAAIYDGLIRSFLPPLKSEATPEKSE